MLEFSRPDGGTTPGYYCENESSKSGVVILQEWWGLNDHMKSIGEDLCKLGFNTLVPDLYKGKLTKDADEAAHLMNGLDWKDATTQDLQGAVNYLTKNGCEKVAVLGFCMGGALTIAAGVHVTGVDAGVCFYGIPPKEFADPSEIKIPIIFHFATKDDWCTPTAVEGLKSDLSKGGVTHEIFIYEADHAFCNKTRTEVFQESEAKLAWERTENFLKSEFS